MSDPTKGDPFASLVIPTIAVALPWHMEGFNPDWDYRVTLWLDGSMRESYVRPGAKVRGFAEGLFKFRNIGLSLPGKWTRMNDEFKISFVREWREGDSVVYVIPVAS
jgi:hypothetical protein